MECNKDEAFRARQIAEKKMENNDFEGARKIALKAQNLYPGLENIAQLLTVCHVHCSGQKRISGSEKDWYGILQVERFADESTIKKQYKRLAFLLHPDKNKFHGAEAAFKLIGEANMVLSDPAKRSVYDNKIRVPVKIAPPSSSHHKTNNPNGGNAQFGGRDQSQTMAPNSVTGQAVFWTSCPFCSGRFQYSREYVNRALRCPNKSCSKAFIAYDLGAQGFPLGSKWAQPGVQNAASKSSQNQPSISAQKEAQNLGSQNTTRFSASHAGTPAGTSSRKVGSEPGPRAENAAEVDGHLKAKETDRGNVKSSNGGKANGPQTRTRFSALQTGAPTSASSRKFVSESGPRAENAAVVSDNFKAKAKDKGNERSLNCGKACGATLNGDAVTRKSANVKNKSRKRGRRVVSESSESSDTSGFDLEDVVEENFDNHETPVDPGPDSFRRLTRRQRQRVSRNESDDNDIAPDELLRNKVSDDCRKGANENGEREFSKTGNQDEAKAKLRMRQTGTVFPEGSSQNKDAESGEVKTERQAAGKRRVDTEFIEIKDDSEIDSDDTNEDKNIHHCPDPEFNNFDKIREENCFSVDQIWACYDSLDCMPRYYAQIRKVLSPGFKLRITWLEADPTGEAENDWVDEELPFGCGRFKLGKTETASECNTFSHQVQFVKVKRGFFQIYPRKGDIWAIFKDWDIKWSCDPEKYKCFKYEIVEVKADFVPGTGIKVAYLDKAKGYLSLFQRTSQSEMDSFLIRPDEMLRFSHQIPFFKMTGSEKKGVPEGSFELDPAALLLELQGGEWKLVC